MPLIKYGLKGNFKKFQVLHFYLKNSVKYKLQNNSKHERLNKESQNVGLQLSLSWHTESICSLIQIFFSTNKNIFSFALEVYFNSIIWNTKLLKLFHSKSTWKLGFFVLSKHQCSTVSKYVIKAESLLSLPTSNIICFNSFPLNRSIDFLQQDSSTKSIKREIRLPIFSPSY